MAVYYTDHISKTKSKYLTYRLDLWQIVWPICHEAREWFDAACSQTTALLTTIKGDLRDMEDSILARILALKTASLSELEKEYSALYDGKKAPSNNKTYLWQRIAYRIQELEYGGLPEDAKIGRIRSFSPERLFHSFF